MTGLMGVIGILVSLAYVCFGGLLLAVLITGLVVLLKVNARLNKQAAATAAPAATEGSVPADAAAHEAPTQSHQ